MLHMRYVNVERGDASIERSLLVYISLAVHTATN